MKTKTATHRRIVSRKPRRLLPPDVARPKLPHERDESAETEGTPRPIIAQAENDIEEGRVDTDNYTRAREVAKRSLTRRRARG